MLNVEPRDYGKTQGFRLKQQAKANLTALARHYNTSETRIVNALLIQQGGKLLEMLERGEKE